MTDWDRRDEVREFLGDQPPGKWVLGNEIAWELEGRIAHIYSSLGNMAKYEEIEMRQGDSGLPEFRIRPES